MVDAGGEALSIPSLFANSKVLGPNYDAAGFQYMGGNEIPIRDDRYSTHECGVRHVGVWAAFQLKKTSHKSVIVFGSSPGRTNQNESRRGLRIRLARHNVIRNFQHGAKRTN